MVAFLTAVVGLLTIILTIWLKKDKSPRQKYLDKINEEFEKRKKERDALKNLSALDSNRIDRINSLVRKARSDLAARIKGDKKD